jgi:ribosome-associated protein
VSGELRIDRRHVIPANELEERASRSSGPGGQGVNTTDSAVELRWQFAASTALSDAEKQRVRENLGTRITDDGVFIVRAAEHRSQHRNRQAARDRLREMVAQAMVPPKRRKRTRPSRAAKRRRLEAKRRRGEVKRLRKPPDH